MGLYKGWLTHRTVVLTVDVSFFSVLLDTDVDLEFRVTLHFLLKTSFFVCLFFKGLEESSVLNFKLTLLHASFSC